jgi:hypothetical protein
MIWFKKVPFFHLPVSAMGGIVLGGTLLVNAYVFKMMDHLAHSVSDLLINFVPYSICIWVVYGWIARNTTK